MRNIKFFEENFRYDPLYPLAMLRVSSDLKGTIWAGINDIIDQTLKELEISEDKLDAYVDEHKDELVQISMELGI